jgi:hypothetical protein
MTNVEKLKSQFPNLVQDIDFEMFDQYGDLNSVITSIDVSNNRIESTYYFMAECGCCTTSDDDVVEVLDDLNYLSDSEFDRLIKELNKSQNI